MHSDQILEMRLTSVVPGGICAGDRAWAIESPQSMMGPLNITEKTPLPFECLVTFVDRDAACRSNARVVSPRAQASRTAGNMASFRIGERRSLPAYTCRWPRSVGVQSPARLPGSAWTQRPHRDAHAGGASFHGVSAR